MMMMMMMMKMKMKMKMKQFAESEIMEGFYDVAARIKICCAEFWLRIDCATPLLRDVHPMGIMMKVCSSPNPECSCE